MSECIIKLRITFGKIEKTCTRGKNDCEKLQQYWNNGWKKSPLQKTVSPHASKQRPASCAHLIIGLTFYK